MKIISTEDFPRACQLAQRILADVKEKRKRFRDGPDTVDVYDLVTALRAKDRSTEAIELRKILDFKGVRGEREKIEPIVRYVLDHYRGGLQ